MAAFIALWGSSATAFIHFAPVLKYHFGELASVLRGLPPKGVLDFHFRRDSREEDGPPHISVRR